MPVPRPMCDGVALPVRFGDVLPPDEQWLAQERREAILLPELPIIDPHHHLWVRPGFRYLVPEFAADVNTGHHIVATVFAECGAMYRDEGPEPLKPVGETEFVIGQVAQSASGIYGPARIAAGLFGYIDLTLGDAVRNVLEAHLGAAGCRFKGVRAQANWDASDQIRNGTAAVHQNLLRDPEVRRALQVLIEFGLVFDVQVFFPQLLEVAEVADEFPDLTIVLNHCGGPLGYGPYANSQRQHYGTWKRGLIEVARRPNVVCKLGGILIRTGDFDYPRADMPASSQQLARAWQRWIEPCIEAFGADRCMFESDYPVEKCGVSYASLWNAFKRMTAAASDDERTAMFFGTAARVYRLDAGKFC